VKLTADSQTLLPRLAGDGGATLAALDLVIELRAAFAAAAILQL
jgi:hypothetical protein